MKFRGDNSKSVLRDYMHNIYTYAMTDNKVPCGWFGWGQCPGVTNSGTNVNYSILCQIVGSDVESLESTWASNCGSPSTVQDVINNCGGYERVLMRKWDYLGTNNTPIILYILYNGDGRVIVTRCEIELDQSGNISGVRCKPQTKKK